MPATTNARPAEFATQEELLAFIQELVQRRKQYRGPERRSAERHDLITEILVVPLDMLLKPSGNPFLAISRDLSENGISFLHNTPTTPFVSVDLTDPATGKTLRAAVEVVRCQPLGALFEIGGKFVYKIYKQA